MIKPTRGFGVPYSAKKRKHKLIDSLASLNPKSIVLNNSSYISSGIMSRGELKTENKRRGLLSSLEDDGDIYDMLKKIIDDSPSSSVNRMTTCRSKTQSNRVSNLRVITEKTRDAVHSEEGTEDNDSIILRLEKQAQIVLNHKKLKA